MIVVIADDLSGAAELAGAALNRGLSAEVQTVFTPATVDVICIDTDTRSMPPFEAARVINYVASRFAGMETGRIYKKCDSVLRGRVLAEIRGIMAATGKSRAVLISANPTRGRIIRSGEYFINGQPLHETAFASDPEHPRRTSRVAELLGGDLSGVLTPDATSTADLIHHASELNNDTLAAGGVEFFDAILADRRPFCPPSKRPRPAHRSIPGPTLLVCGSAVAWPKRVEAAARSQFPSFSLPHDVAAIVRALRTAPIVAIGIGNGPATQGRSPAELVKQLAISLRSILVQTTANRLLLEGGATAAAVLRDLGWTRLTACRPCAPGMGMPAPIGTDGVEVGIKPGSYDWPEEMWPS